MSKEDKLRQDIHHILEDVRGYTVSVSNEWVEHIIDRVRAEDAVKIKTITDDEWETARKAHEQRIIKQFNMTPDVVGQTAPENWDSALRRVGVWAKENRLSQKTTLRIAVETSGHYGHLYVKNSSRQYTCSGCGGVVKLQHGDVCVFNHMTHGETGCIREVEQDGLPDQCEHGEAVSWNEFNKVVQCHHCGQEFVPKVYDMRESAGEIADDEKSGVCNGDPQHCAVVDGCVCRVDDYVLEDSVGVEEKWNEPTSISNLSIDCGGSGENTEGIGANSAGKEPGCSLGYGCLCSEPRPSSCYHYCPRDQESRGEAAKNVEETSVFSPSYMSYRGEYGVNSVENQVPPPSPLAHASTPLPSSPNPITKVCPPSTTPPYPYLSTLANDIAEEVARRGLRGLSPVLPPLPLSDTCDCPLCRACRP